MAEEAAREAERRAEQALADLESYELPPAPELPRIEASDYVTATPRIDLPELPEYDLPELPEYEAPEYEYEAPDYTAPDYTAPDYGAGTGGVGGSTYPGATGGVNEAGYPKNQYVSPHTRADGTRVDGYWRNSPNDSLPTCRVTDC